MKDSPSPSAVREQTETIVKCQSLDEIQTLILNLEREFNSYSISDQGFLLSMIGITIMKISDDSSYCNLHDSQMKLLLLTRIHCQNPNNTEEGVRQ